MFVNQLFPYYFYGYRGSDYFYRSEKHMKFLKWHEIEEKLINECKNDLLDLFVTKWAMNWHGEYCSGLYFDIDCDNLEYSYKKSLELYYFLKNKFKLRTGISFVFSGNKGFHIEVSEITLGLDRNPYKNMVMFYKWLAKKFEKELNLQGVIDFRVYEYKRLWRLEKSVHSKTKLFCHRLPENLIGANLKEIKLFCKYQQNYPLIYDVRRTNFFARGVLNEYYKEFVEFMNEKQKEKIQRNKFDIEKNELPYCIMSLLQKKIHEGKRNITLYTI